MAKATKKTKKTHGRPMQLSRTAGTLSRDGSQGGTSQAGHDVVVIELDPRYCDVIRRRFAEFASRPDLAP